LTLHHRHIDALHAFHGDVLGPKIGRKHHAWFLESLVSQQVMDPATATANRQVFNALQTPKAQQSHLQRMSTQSLSAASLAA
jgi:tRNA-dihydrouridine synthase B